ncbi:ABC transporter ATP-binding protein [Nocardiopsis sp. MG754419]|uniref:ABC transporter ATP-binding protein n=1 Tax=Nocardiopsis sp. MG754419 TaxID=2259865 RepID=UPI001BAAD8C6|nr:ATP-binding cassette domain-containing protein [Nocardiopsis sp. MG754419]MBR8743241.1 ABC transporter ATP-binding protein [Nocardiopsis sp. MG754419]
MTRTTTTTGEHTTVTTVDPDLAARVGEHGVHDRRTGPHTVPVLRVRDVDVVRGGASLLREISLTIHAGEHWALLGANGAGKTTLLRLLGAVAHPTRGTVEVLGHRLGRVDLRDLRSFIGHVDPRHTPDGPLSLREVVLTGLSGTTARPPRWTPTDAEADRAEHLIDLLGLSPRVNARWPTLSQGERGRALIARALMPEPRLLLLDEPATGLDVAGREQLIERIDTLQDTRPDLATVLVTHHLEELPPGTTHALLLREGAHQASGPVEEVLTAERVGACFDHPLRLTRVDGRWAVHSARRPRTRP